MEFELAAAAAFGLEAVLKRELAGLGYKDVNTCDGNVFFKGGLKDIAIANTWLRCAERVSIVLKRFKAVTFEELFEGVRAVDWCDFMPLDAAFTVAGKSRGSVLSSVPACQSVAEKAIIEKLKTKYNIKYFPKTGSRYKITVSLNNDEALITLDTTGESLHKRGYRKRQQAAPIKETLAAAMIELSYWRKERPFADFTCGSGTIPIEAAMLARKIAPGLKRSFSAEQFDFIAKSIWKEIRAEAYAAIDFDFTPDIYASDIAPDAIEIAKGNARLAGVDDCIRFSVSPLSDMSLNGDYGSLISNPPYAERIGSISEIEVLYSDIGRLARQNDTWSFYIITSNDDFERLFGKKADKRRKLFNGSVKACYYQFYGTKPPAKHC